MTDTDTDTDTDGQTRGAIPMYVTCKECLLNTRVERLNPTVDTAMVKHCPMCGSSNITVDMGFSKDYWYVMARAANLVPSEVTAQLVKDLYDIWDPRDQPKFIDFVHDTIRQA